MSQAQKLIFNPAFFDGLCPVLEEYIDGFNGRDFIYRVFNNEWPDMEWTERTRHIAKAIQHFLSRDFSNAARQLANISLALKNVGNHYGGIEYVFLGTYLEVYGLYPDEEPALPNEEVIGFTSRHFTSFRFLGQAEPA
ncbi:MAG TPA: hypothetical protein VF490_22145 [Chryseosolibacter sp.]